MPAPIQQQAAHTRAQLATIQPARRGTADPERTRLVAELQAALAQHLHAQWAGQAGQLAEYSVGRWLITGRPLLDCVDAEVALGAWATRYGRTPATT